MAAILWRRAGRSRASARPSRDRPDIHDYRSDAVRPGLPAWRGLLGRRHSELWSAWRSEDLRRAASDRPVATGRVHRRPARRADELLRAADEGRESMAP